MNKIVLCLLVFLMVFSSVSAGEVEVFLSGDNSPVFAEGDSGDFEWFLEDGEFVSVQKFVAPEDLSNEFLLDFGTLSLVLTEHETIPGNLVPLLKANVDSTISFSAMFEGDADWRLWIYESNNRILPREIASGVTKLDLLAGDKLVLYFNANDYGLVKLGMNSAERDFRVWVDITKFDDWQGKLTEFPSGEGCTHFMSKELSMFYCKREVEMCLDKYVGSNPSQPLCSWDDIFSCNFDVCYENLAVSSRAEIDASERARQEALADTDPELAQRVGAMEGDLNSLARTIGGLELSLKEIGFGVAGALSNYGLLFIFGVLFVGVGGSVALWWVRNKNKNSHRRTVGFARQPFVSGQVSGARREREQILEEVKRIKTPEQKPVVSSEDNFGGGVVVSSDGVQGFVSRSPLGGLRERLLDAWLVLTGKKKGLYD